jgi:hypothetical protein
LKECEKAMKYLAVLLLVSIVAAVAESPEQVNAKVISISKYRHGRVQFFEQQTPVYDHSPLYDIEIQVGGKSYFVRYEAGPGAYYPPAWAVGKQIQAKRERGRFILMDGNKAVPARIVPKDSCIPQPNYEQAVPQLPCPEGDAESPK